MTLSLTCAPSFSDRRNSDDAPRFWLVANMLEGFSVSGFWAAFWGALAYSVVSWAFSTLLSGERR